MAIYEASVSLVARALVVSARRAARGRRLSLERVCARVSLSTPLGTGMGAVGIG